MTDLSEPASGTEPAPDHTVAAAAPAPEPAPGADPVAVRLQARLEVIEATPELLQPSPPRRRVEAAPPHPGLPGDHEAAIKDLNAQLDLLRDQLEAAFDDADTRIAAAQLRAEEADTRAQVASARAANVLAAVDGLIGDLTQIAEHSDAAGTRRIRAAADRLRQRIQPS